MGTKVERLRSRSSPGETKTPMQIDINTEYEQNKYTEKCRLENVETSFDFAFTHIVCLLCLFAELDVLDVELSNLHVRNCTVNFLVVVPKTHDVINLLIGIHPLPVHNVPETFALRRFGRVGTTAPAPRTVQNIDTKANGNRIEKMICEAIP